LERGATYYIADGNYSPYFFDDAEDGERYIYIKKAIESDHGTYTGWQSSYGNGQAVFIINSDDSADKLVFYTSYYVFDGQTGGGPGSWDSGHGFRVIPAEDANLCPADAKFELIRLGNGWSPTNIPNYIEFRHIEITSPYRDKYDDEHAIFENINMWPGTFPDTNDNKGPQYVTISHCYIHDLKTQIWTVYAGFWTVEYNYFARNDVFSAEQYNQGSAWIDFGSDDITIRFNIFEDIDGTANLDIKKNYAHNNYRWEIYGNVFWNTPDANIGGTGNGVIGDTGDQGGPSATSDMKVYNNAFININANVTLGGWHAGIYFGASLSTGNVAYNNLWYNCRSRDLGGNDWYEGFDEHDYSWYYGNTEHEAPYDATLVASEANAQLGAGNPFADWQNMSFSLTSATDAGLTLPAPYNKDMFGVTRGADGNWDRGAIEFV